LALARKACNRVALSPVLMGLGVEQGTRATHLLLSMECCSPLWDGEETRPGALHGGSLHVLPPPPPFYNVLMPSHSSCKLRPSDKTCQLTGHSRLQSVALNKQKQNAQALRPEKDFSKPHLSSHFPFNLHASLPTSSRMPLCSHTTQHGSTPLNCDFPN
jgi:hypothetical protein